ncbi:Mu-like prophage major head subunit gpT family protein [Novosphingobium sp.]|uniref:Mu-like prophage major head subunit gpT family protein n=1 Tax=Novosphingobium sp. TaxID=1874826 RepID=UPI003562E744
MLITSENLARLNVGFNSKFNGGFSGAETVYDKICMRANSSGSEEVYAWLGQLPSIREWIGSRTINNLELQGFSIENKKFESTVSVPRTSIEDDKVGAFAPLFEDLGRRAAEFPDVLFASLVGSGFNTNCYDGQFFFDTDHPVTAADGVTVLPVSNMQAGAGPAWFLLDLSRPVRPFIYQERMPFILQRRTNEGDENVFVQDDYHYGVRGRCNVGFGLWQMAYASKAPLTVGNYETARAALANMRGDNGRKLGVKGTHLLVPSAIEGDGRRIVKNQLSADGSSNPWIDSAELIVSPWLD